MPSRSLSPRRPPGGGWIGWALATLGACGLSALFVTAAFWPTETDVPRTRRVALPTDLGACSTNADCVIVDRIGCCTCRTGGAQWAVNATQVDALRRFLKRECKNQTACLQIDACRRDLTAVCRAATCTVAVAPTASDGRADG